MEKGQIVRAWQAQVRLLVRNTVSGCDHWLCQPTPPGCNHYGQKQIVCTIIVLLVYTAQQFWLYPYQSYLPTVCARN